MVRIDCGRLLHAARLAIQNALQLIRVLVRGTIIQSHSLRLRGHVLQIMTSSGHV